MSARHTLENDILQDLLQPSKVACVEACWEVCTHGTMGIFPTCIAKSTTSQHISMQETLEGCSRACYVSDSVFMVP